MLSVSKVIQTLVICNNLLCIVNSNTNFPHKEYSSSAESSNYKSRSSRHTRIPQPKLKDLPSGDEDSLLNEILELEGDKSETTASITSEKHYQKNYDYEESESDLSEAAYFL